MGDNTLQERIPPANGEEPPVNRPEMWNQLTNAINLRSSQDQVLWTIFGAFWATSAILLVALFTTGKLPENPVVGIAVASVGAAISLAWHFIQKRALGHVGRYEELMRKLEVELSLRAGLAVSTEINREDYVQYVGEGPRARKVMPVCSLGGFILWCSAAAYFVWRCCRA